MIGELFSELWRICGAWLIPIIAELVIFLLLSTLMGITLFHLSITVGSVIAKKAKILASVGMYYVFNMAISMFMQLSTYLFVFFIEPGISMIEITSDTELLALLSLVFLVAIAFVGIITALLYNLTQHLLDRKLNLA